MTAMSNAEAMITSYVKTLKLTPDQVSDLNDLVDELKIAAIKHGERSGRAAERNRAE